MPCLSLFIHILMLCKASDVPGHKTVVSVLGLRGFAIPCFASQSSRFVIHRFEGLRVNVRWLPGFRQVSVGQLHIVVVLSSWLLLSSLSLFCSSWSSWLLSLWSSLCGRGYGGCCGCCCARLLVPPSQNRLVAIPLEPSPKYQSPQSKIQTFGVHFGFGICRTNLDSK